MSRSALRAAFERMFGPAVSAAWEPAPGAAPDTLALVAHAVEAPADPALNLLVERVLYATNGFGYVRQDVEAIVSEALWQVGHLIRQGARVEVPDLGVFQRRTECGGTRIAYLPDPDLLESNDA